MLAIPNTTTTALYTDVGAAQFPATEAGGSTPFVQGFAIIANAAVFVSVLKGRPGAVSWTQDTLIAPTTLPLTVDRLSKTEPQYIFGVRFRDGVAGTHAQVFGALFQAGELAFIPGSDFTSTVSAGGGYTPGGSSVITGLIPAAGTTPTAGTGFTYTHTNGTGVYVFTYTTPFAATAAVLVTSNTNNTNLFVVSASSPTGFTVTNASQAADHAFTFTAQTVN